MINIIVIKKKGRKNGKFAFVIGLNPHSNGEQIFVKSICFVISLIVAFY